MLLLPSFSYNLCAFLNFHVQCAPAPLLLSNFSFSIPFFPCLSSLKKKTILSFLALWLCSPFLCSCPRAVLGSAAS